MKTYRDLQAWKIGMLLLKEIKIIVEKFPQYEIYGLSKQLRNASSSILANFAEGNGRYTYKDKTAKYVIARGECTEVEAFIHIAIELGYVSIESCQKALSLVDEEGKILSGLISATRKKITNHRSIVS